MPGLIDTHIHASQYSYAGTALDMPLLKWLNTYTFPVESHFKDLEFARKVYTQVVVSPGKLASLRAKSLSIGSKQSLLGHFNVIKTSFSCGICNLNSGEV